MPHASPCVDCSVVKRMPQACPLVHPSIACTKKLRQAVWSNHSMICDELELHEAVYCRSDLQSAAWLSGSIPSALTVFIHQPHPWIANHRILKIPAPFHHSFSTLRCSTALCPSTFWKAIILPSLDESRTTEHLSRCEIWHTLANKWHVRCRCNIVIRMASLCAHRKSWCWKLRTGRTVCKWLRQLLNRGCRSFTCASMSRCYRLQARFSGLGFFHPRTPRLSQWPSLGVQNSASESFTRLPFQQKGSCVEFTWIADHFDCLDWVTKVVDRRARSLFCRSYGPSHRSLPLASNPHARCAGKRRCIKVWVVLKMN